MIRPLALACLFTLFATPALADDTDQPLFDQGDELVMSSEGFLSSHPDLRWRGEGLEALQEDRAGEAFDYFKRAAKYADKPSQAMVAEMLWTGTGTPMDRPLAYAWMDVAAERAYIPFLAKREQYWNALSEAEQARALEVGAPSTRNTGTRWRRSAWNASWRRRSGRSREAAPASSVS